VLHSSAVIAALSTSKQATFACVPNKLHVAVTSAAIQLITPIAGATGVVPVAVTLLSQEVLHAMFLTKLRVLGLFAAVALGVTTSVVLAAQSDDRPGQSDDRTSSSPRADRLESIEKKLDKLIEVLGDRAARTAPAPVVYGSADVHPAHPTPSVRAVPALPNPIPPGVAAAVPPPAAPIATPYSDAHAWPSPHPVPALAPADAASDHRVAELEKRVKDLEKRLEMLERALGELGDQPAARPVSPRQNTRADTRPAPTPGAR
jgi:hypothetical protein